jgi:hypothetical protein
MEDVLRGRRFDTFTTLTGGAATRAGIVAALQQLVNEIEPADAVVVYYSGHGGRVPRPDAEQRVATGSTTHFHFLVPFDIDSSAPGDFRGLLSEEMTVLQRQMTDAFLARGAVPNVTTILDCCHSGYFARAADAWQKSVDLEEKSLRLHGIREHAQRLGAAASVEAGATNPHAVRLVACQPEQSAYELTTGGGGRHGAMTDAFASILGSLGDHPVSWAVLADLVRRRVRARLPEQRPDVEGPSALALFSTDQAAVRDALPVTVLDGRAVVECGPLLGVEVGDELRLEQLGGAEVGNATVASIDGSNAVLTVSGVDAALPADVVAVRTTTKRPRYPVAIGAGEAAALLDRHLTSSTRVRPALDGEPVLAQVEHLDGLVVRTRSARGGA